MKQSYTMSPTIKFIHYAQIDLLQTMYKIISKILLLKQWFKSDWFIILKPAGLLVFGRCAIGATLGFCWGLAGHPAWGPGTLGFPLAVKLSFFIVIFR